MITIDVDFDVFKALTNLRATEDVSYNEVLRGLLKLEPAKKHHSYSESASSGKDWVTKGVRFPFGTEFRATYKGKTFQGKVENGALFLNGEEFESPSRAAMSITKNPVNGWVFWECRRPGDTSWQLIGSLRKRD